LVSTDIFIVGGGPAGLAAAIAARQRGFNVTVADGAVPPIDKACGEGLMPDSLVALAGLGIEVPEESFAFRGIRFFDRGTTVEASFPTGPGRGVRRTGLHRAMLDRAAAIGVRFRWGAPVDPDSLLGESRWIIGADGANSRVRKWGGLNERVGERVRFGFRRHYRIAPWSEYVEIYWARNYQVYVTPVAPDSVGVATLAQDSHLRLDAAIQGVPELVRRLGGADIISTDRGSVSASRELRSVYRDRLALIGDASGSVDAITGEGICLALHQAQALANGIERGELGEYQAEHRRIARRPQLMAKLLLSLGDHAAFRSIAMHAMSACPPIFAKMLAFHVGNSYENSRIPADPHGSAAGAGDGAAAGSGSDSRPVHIK
jgi:flavin-dependent dehydrogenase